MRKGILFIFLYCVGIALGMLTVRLWMSPGEDGPLLPRTEVGGGDALYRIREAVWPDTAGVRNVIYMIGDGMGVAQVTALMLAEEPRPLNLERATAVGLVKTFSADRRVTDSAAAGTALATGRKTNNGTIGIAPDGTRLESIMAAAAARGLLTGLVVTTLITDATPAAFYAHVHSRGSHDSIAVQLLASGVDLFFGGGRRHFDRRKDGRDLTAEFESRGYSMVFSTEDIDGLGPGRAGALLADGSMDYASDGRGDYLPRATSKALEMLSADPAGFFLMVEGSLIDHAGHKRNAKGVKGEMADFDRAVGVAFDFADRHPGTLVVVVADHETGGLTIPKKKGDHIRVEGNIKYKFSTSRHTAVMVPLFAYGTGSEYFTGVFDNTEIPAMIDRLLIGN